MVRLVFRPYTQLRRSICTSESLRSSTRVSPGFNLARHSSPSFGSQRACSCCSARNEVDAKRRGCAPYGDHPSDSKLPFAFTTPLGFVSPLTRMHARLLGPCFKTGRRHRRPTHDRDASRASKDTHRQSPLRYPPGTKPGTGGSRRPKAPRTSPRPSVRSQRFVVYERREVRPASEHDEPGESSRISHKQASPPHGLNLDAQLRGCLRLPLHSFTYS